MSMMFSSLSFAEYYDSEYPHYYETVVKPFADNTHTSVVHCGPVFVYVTHAQWLKIARNQRAGIDSYLDINGEFIEAPCVPSLTTSHSP